MKPTLEPGDTIFVAKWPFGLKLPGTDITLTQGRLPARGEVVIYAPPHDPNRQYIKRVIGLPGDTVEIRATRVVLNGKSLAIDTNKNSPCGKEYLPEGHSYLVCWEPPLLEDRGPEKVPEGSVFLIGDYRSQPVQSLRKSKLATPSSIVPISTLGGKALWIWLSVEPNVSTQSASSFFPQFRFERFFRKVE